MRLHRARQGHPLHRLRVGFDFAISGRKEVDGMITRHAGARHSASSSACSDDGRAALATSYERWDGKGFPGDLPGAAIPIAGRIAQLAEFVR